jgi:hypothetical protein
MVLLLLFYLPVRGGGLPIENLLFLERARSLRCMVIVCKEYYSLHGIVKDEVLRTGA